MQAEQDSIDDEFSEAALSTIPEVTSNQKENNETLLLSHDLDEGFDIINRMESLKDTSDNECHQNGIVALPHTNHEQHSFSGRVIKKHDENEMVSKVPNGDSFCKVAKSKKNKNVYYKNQSTQVENYDFICNGITSYPIRLYSDDKKQYIEKYLENGKMIYSGQFYEDGIDIAVYGKNHLFTSNQDNFVARIQINVEVDLDFSKSFINVKKNFLKKITITKILEDELSRKGNDIYCSFKQFLRSRSKQTAYSLQVVEDFLQLSIILERYQKYNYEYISLLSMFYYMLNNKYISIEFKSKIKEILKVERTLDKRNKYFPISDYSFSYFRNFVRDLEVIVIESAVNHRDLLLFNCNKIKTSFSNLLESNLKRLSNQQIFYIRTADLNLFSDLITIMDEDIFGAFLIDLCNSFFSKIKKRYFHTFITELAPLTHVVYFYLCKSFKELVLIISDSAGISPKSLLKKESGRWVFAKNIDLSSLSLPNKSFEKQCRLIFKLMSHFKPGYYLQGRKFCYELNSAKKTFWFFNGITNPMLKVPQDRLVWIYILDAAISNLLTEEQIKLLEPISESHKNFIIETKDDLYGLFQEVTHNTAKFIILISPYFTKQNSKVSTDMEILKKQLIYFYEIIRDKHFMTTNFRDLIDVYHDYWKTRESIIKNIPNKFPYGTFKNKMEGIFKNLIKIIIIALSKETNPTILIKFFREFNDFINELDSIEFKWFIKKDNENLDSFFFPYTKLINKAKGSYEVLDPEGFIKKCNMKIPRNFLIELIDELLHKIIKLLEKTDWCDNDILNASNELFTAIRKSFLYFKEQPNYVSFEIFKDENTKPFDSIIDNSKCYQDFMKRISILGECFWYLRKQDEIDINKALELYKAKNNGEDTDVLEKCYQRYSEKFNFYIEKTISENYKNKIKIIVDEVMNHESIKIDEWDEEFKNQVVPDILAGLAAVWSIQESKDISSTGKSLKPHCIQILCIFKLLSVDLNSRGLQKHLSEVLTGQGKSLVLGLLSTLLTLMGHKVFIVCYSKYLANRDQNDFSNFFEKFNVCKKITYGTFSGIANEAINPIVNGVRKNLRNLIIDRVFNHNVEQTEKFQQANSSEAILLIDEVDIFFTDDFYGKCYLPCTLIKMEAFATIQEEIWIMAKNGDTKHNIFKKIEEFVNDMVREGNQNFLELKKFLNNSRKYYLLKINSSTAEREYTNKTLYEEHIEMMIDFAIQIANTTTDQYQNYIINDEGLIGVRNNFGITEFNLIHYEVLFNYFRLKEKDFQHKNYNNFGYLYIECGSVSYAKLPENYSLILGVSGTLTNLHAHERKTIHESYNINKISHMPSFYGHSNLIFDSLKNVIIENSEETWIDKIFHNADLKLSSGISVLIFFDSHCEIDEFKKRYVHRFTRLNILTQDTKNEIKEKYIEEAGITKTVTLAVKGIGRGTDFKSSLTVEKNGGMHVIQTFFSLDIKEEIQIKGRTALKDNKGSYELILCKEHLNRNGLIGSDYQTLNENRNQLMNNKGLTNRENIIKSENAHKATMNFLRSFFK